jgi:microsomal epoxide hydrolase
MKIARPFTVNISQLEIDDLQRRLANSRWPDQVNDKNWSYGTDIGYLKKLVDYWQNDFDWKTQEKDINKFDQYLLDIDGLDIHFIHQRSPHTSATPLIITHGWPGCFLEFLDLIPRLTEPEKFGGRSEDAFHVICPSLPGYGFSSAAIQTGMTTRKIAERHIKLMSALGYDSYIAQGGDWGTMVTRHTADLDPEHCKAIHLNMVLAFPPKNLKDPMSVVTEEEKKVQIKTQDFLKDGMGYFKIQSSRPQTLAYGLNDSPIGLCAWLTEKYHAWTDCNGEIRTAMNWDKLLTIISLYWHTESIGSSMRLYLEEKRSGHLLESLDIPTGAAIYHKEIVQPPKAWIEASYDLVHFYKADKGGHFAALEQPEMFARDLWEFKEALTSE